MPDRREYLAELNTSLLAWFESFKREMWSAMPGIIDSYDATKQTASVRPAIKAKITNEKGEFRYVEIPLLVDCPVVFPSGGGFLLTFPVRQGDECLVVFASRCIDSWWQSGGVQVPPDNRAHDLSDGFVIMSPRSQPKRVTPAPSTTKVELRSDDGQSRISIDQSNIMVLATPGEIQATSSSKIKLTAPTIELNGHVVVTGNVDITGAATTTGDVTVGGKSFNGHKHGGVTIGGGQTGTPV